MSIYWGLKKVKTDREYVVIKHPLRIQGNLQIEGIKFCAGFGVVEKGTKAHQRILKLPMFRKSQVFGLEVLKKAGFRPKEVQLIFGYDIFRHYLDAIGLKYPELTPLVKEVPQPFDEVKVEELIAENKEELDKLPDVPSTLPTEEVLASRKEAGLCLFKKEDGEFCENKAFQYSKGGMCFGHIKYDPTRKIKEEESKTEETEINTKEEL